MGQTKFEGDVYIPGQLAVVGALSLPPSSVRKENIPASENVQWDKLQHLHVANYSQPQQADVASAREVVHYFRKAGGVDYVVVVPDDAPTGGDKAYTVDVKYSVGGGTWTTILSAVLSFGSSDTSRVAKSGTITVPTFAAGTSIAVVVTASGSTGTQGKGVGVLIGCWENSAG